MRKVVSNINGMFQAELLGNNGVDNWKFAKEIEEPKTEENIIKAELIERLKELIKKLE